MYLDCNEARKEARKRRGLEFNSGQNYGAEETEMREIPRPGFARGREGVENEFFPTMRHLRNVMAGM